MSGARKSAGPAVGAAPAKKRAPRKRAAKTSGAAVEAVAPPQPPPAAAQPTTLAEALANQTPESFASLSRNLGEAVTRANQVFSTALLDQTLANRPLRADPFEVAPALNSVWASLAAQPDTLRTAHAELWKNYLDIWERYTQATLIGAPAFDEIARDKRFRDPEWRTNPAFSMLRETYLATAGFITSLVDKAEGVDADAKRKAAFFVKQAVDAASPSNFLFTNPAALRALVESNGESLLKGIDNLGADLKRGQGMLSITQADLDAFKVGETIATTPGKVVFRNDLLELIQYAPTTARVRETPLLIFPPWINKFYILDLKPENSLIRWLVAQGETVFLVSWVNPDEHASDATFEDYMRDGIYAALDAVQKATGAAHVNAVGYCIGGTLLAATLAHMARRNDNRISAATFFASQSDFELSGDLRIFADNAGIRYLEDRMVANGGVLDSQAMADTFNALRANDLVWNYVVDNYYLGKSPPPFDLLFWNADQTRMPKALHLFYLRCFYRDNALAKGELTLLGEKVALGDVKIPILMQAGREDHIAPAPSVYRTALLFGGPTEFVLAGSGHIAGVVNPPAAKRYQHWTNAALPARFEAWLADASEHAGSWWPHWDAWLATHSGPLVPARDPENGGLKPLCDAPGEYVRVRSQA